MFKKLIISQIGLIVGAIISIVFISDVSESLYVWFVLTIGYLLCYFQNKSKFNQMQSRIEELEKRNQTQSKTIVMFRERCNKLMTSGLSRNPKTGRFEKVKEVELFDRERVSVDTTVPIKRGL